MKQEPCYIKINETDGYVFTTGVSFNLFMSALPKIPNGLLLLKGFPPNALFDVHTGLEYIPQIRMSSFLRDNDVYNYGDFCWADFKSETDIQKITAIELSEMLFAAHLKRPLHRPFFDSLKNDYLYLCHDDDYWVKIYMKDLGIYKRVIEQKIRSVLLGRKRSMPPIPEKILNKLYRFFTSGGVFDFENCTISSIDAGVRIYPAEKIGFCPDEIHRTLDHQRNIAKIGFYLDYNPKTKKWALL